jgi:hypothetical protein
VLFLGGSLLFLAYDVGRGQIGKARPPHFLEFRVLTRNLLVILNHFVTALWRLPIKYYARFIIVLINSSIHPTASNPVFLGTQPISKRKNTSVKIHLKNLSSAAQPQNMSSPHLTQLRKWMLASPPVEWGVNQLRELLIGALRQGPIPQHVAFVMDGNRRYARSHKIETVEGHNLGFEALARVKDVQQNIVNCANFIFRY